MFITHINHVDYIVGMRSMALSPDNERVAVGFDDGTIRVWDVPFFRELAHHTHMAEFAHVFGLAWRADGDMLFSTSADSYRVLAWSKELTYPPFILYQGPESDDDEEEHFAWDGFQPGILQADPTGHLLACGDSNGRIKIWDVASQRLYTEIEAHTHHVLSIVFHPAGSHLASASYDGTIGFWHIDGQGQTVSAPGLEQVRGIDWSPDGNRVLCTGYAPLSHRRPDESWPILQTWNPWTGSLINQHIYSNPWGDSLAIHPFEPVLAVGHSDATISLWNINTWTLIETVRGGACTVAYLKWSADGTLLISGGYGPSNQKNGMDVWKIVNIGN